MTLERPDLARRLTVVRQPRKLPLVLSAKEVALLLEAAPGPNRHCPKCQGAAARDWLAERQAELFPVP